jgi:putative transposase
MPRLARIAVAGYPHHVIQRGNNRQAIFLDDQDRSRYLELLREAAREHDVAIHAYVLMGNHVHLLATPAGQRGLSDFMHKLGTRYVGWFNHRHQRTGTLWEGRFRSNLIESDSYLLVCTRYIELNPVRVGMVEMPADWRWSSARHHLGLGTDPVITEHSIFWNFGNTPFEREVRYREFLMQSVPAGEAQAFTRACLRGRALGSPEFLTRAGQPTQPRKRGRPFKKNLSPIK